MTRSLHQTLRRAGLPLRGVHALRHTFATRAMESGMDLRTLSEILGHSQVALTLQLYAHSTMETKRDVMEKMDVFPKTYQVYQDMIRCTRRYDIDSI